MPDETLTEAEKEAARTLAQGIVRAQTNVFIKELLRDNGVKIGATKADFEKNMLEAIDEGKLRLQGIEDWLNRVEGWGSQHVYLYNLPADTARLFSKQAEVKKLVSEAGLADYWAAPTSQVFPDEIELTGINFETSLLMAWHKGTQYWVRANEKYDKPEEKIDGDIFQFRAYRGRSVREVMRFELRPEAQLAGLFIPKPANSKEHRDAIANAKDTIGKLVDLQVLEENPVRLNNVIKNLDQSTAFKTGKGEAVVSPQSTRLKSGDAYVEFASLSTEGTYLDSQDVKDVRLAIRNQQIGNFEGSSGSFRFPTVHQARVQLFASERRIRLWTSLTDEDVWLVLEALAAHQQ